MASIGGTVRVLQVPLSPSSLNNGDVFILDTGNLIYQFIATNAALKERTRAMEIVEQDIRASRDGEPDVIYLDGDDVFTCEEFWDVLGGKIDVLPEEDPDRDYEGGDNVDFSGLKKLMKISDENGELVMEITKEDEVLSVDDVNEDDVWVVAIDGQCFIYKGLGVSKEERYYVCNNVPAILAAVDLEEGARTVLISKESDPDTWERLFS